MQNGGLRIKGITKKSTDEKPLISVVTVVYNGESTLEQTIQSVVNQTYDNVEYIIVDGDSKDGTLDIIKKYEDKIDYWQSEPDKGIYDAMNKGIELATGCWINFMNSGDSFCNTTIIHQIFNNRIWNCDIIYGDSIEYDGTYEKKIIANKPLSKLNRGPIFRHNAAFFKLSIQKNNLFEISRKDLGYGLDFKLIYNLYNQGKEFKRVDIFVVRYDKNGVSNNRKLNNLYTYRILKEVHPIKAKIYYICKKIYNMVH